jgi:hypothetical protein
MKNKSKKMIIIPVVFLVLIIISCDSLIAPQSLRLNPYDENNPIPLPTSYELTFDLSNPDNRVVNLSWVDPANEADSDLIGYLILRKTGSASETVWDGTVVGINEQGNLNLEDYEFITGTRNYYSIYSYGHKPAYQNSDKNLSIGPNSNLEEYEYFNFTGPITASATPWKYVDVPASSDGTMENPTGTTWSMSAPYLIVRNHSTNPDDVSGISFTLPNISGSVVKYVSLSLTKSASSLAGGMYIGALTSLWSDYATWSPGIDTAGTFEEYLVSVSGGSGDVVTLNVTTIYNAWNDGEQVNNGFRLKTNDADMAFSFHSSEEGSNGPKLRIMLFDE